MNMTYEDFCTLNGIQYPDIMHSLDSAVFPEGEFCPDFTIVLYSTDGISPIMIDGKEYQIRRKSISVWRPGQRISFVSDPSLKYQLLAISGDLQQHLNVSSVFLTLFVAQEYPVIRVTSAYNDALHHFFDSIKIVCNFQDNPYKKDCMLSILRALFFSTGYYVFRSLRFRSGDLYKFASEYPAYENSVTSKFIKLVEEYSMTERHLSFYARKLDYNPKYLSALIKRETGRSGQNLIDQYSVLSAMAKLSYGHRSIKEISDEMDFQSQSDFGKFFKRLTGFSPLAYRKSRFSSISGKGGL